MRQAGIFRTFASALAGSVAAIVLLGTVPAAAQNITISGACAGGSWSFSNSALTCTPSANVLTCNPTATPSNPLLGVSSTIAAGCTGATSWQWTAGASNSANGCPPLTDSSSASFSLSSGTATAGGCTYTVQASDGTRNGSGSATVTWSAAPVFACSFSPVPSTATVGTGLPLTVSCNGTPSLSTWSATGQSGNVTWGTAQIQSGSNTVTNTVTLPSPGSWNISATVTGPNGATSTPVAGVSATASLTSSTNLCADKGFSKTIFYNWDWAGAQPSHLDTAYMNDMAGGQGIGTNGILVVKFTPNGPLDLDNPTTTSATGYPAPNLINYLTLAISTQPCELYNAAAPGSSTSTSPTVQYAVGTVTRPWAGPKRSIELTPGATYYLNVASRENVGPSSPYGTNTCVNLPGGWNCDIRLSPQKPPGH